MTDVLPSGLATSEFSSDIRPQDDLYRHVNGAWLDAAEIPADKARWGSFHMLAEQAEKDVRAIIEESTDAEPGTLARKVGDLYSSFMDTERIAALGVAPLVEQLTKVDRIDSIRSSSPPSARSTARASPPSSASSSSPTRATPSATCPSPCRRAFRFPTRATTVKTASPRPAPPTARISSGSSPLRASRMPRARPSVPSPSSTRSPVTTGTTSSPAMP
ncbi:hypothetical protein GCM10025863_28360 [Microbacterium suwonense]|uniref:Peptidase M13 N-terminal domain-containing protein n=1 Tax=Microbacterium suwonense TaxID=683047 RepID=A0ABN6X657_9MICO|nr:hypothetical protein GCM10025863_28360 [Microbacterium suwonense]